MQDARAAAPWLGTPLVPVPVDGVDIGQVQQRRDGGLLGTLAGEEVGGGLGEDDADGEGVLVLGQRPDDDGDCAHRSDCDGELRVIYSGIVPDLLLMVATDPEALR